MMIKQTCCAEDCKSCLKTSRRCSNKDISAPATSRACIGKLIDRIWLNQFDFGLPRLGKLLFRVSFLLPPRKPPSEHFLSFSAWPTVHLYPERSFGLLWKSSATTPQPHPEVLKGLYFRSSFQTEVCLNGFANNLI